MNGLRVNVWRVVEESIRLGIESALRCRKENELMCDMEFVALAVGNSLQELGEYFTAEGEE